MREVAISAARKQSLATDERPASAHPQVVLSTLGKFHTFDLARQLYNRGALKAIFSGYPSFKLGDENLPASVIRTFPFLHAPYMRLGSRCGPFKNLWERQDRFWLDRYVRARLPECDVFCGLSGSGLRTGELAKKRGARYVCDRGSSHIRHQDNILRSEYDRQNLPYSGIDPWIIRQEEAEYALADVITVPSKFAFDSFLDYGQPSQKLRLVPYGVDLSRFYKVMEPPQDEFRVLFVGALSVRKGISYLIEAFDQLQHRRKHLTLLGSLSPELAHLMGRLSERPDVSMLGPVPQTELKNHMSKSHVMVLPSIEEGLALVQAQAMACACPLICSTHTGASDLFSDGVEGFIVTPRDSAAIADRLQLIADRPDLRERMSCAALERVGSIHGWSEYGQNMYSLFCELSVQ